MPRAKFVRLEPEKVQFNGLDQKLMKDDRVHQGTEDKLVDCGSTMSKTGLKLPSENKEEQLNQLKGNTGSERERNPEPEKDRLEKDEDGIVFPQDALMDKEQRLAERALKNCGRRGYRGDGQAKEIRPESLTQGKKTWTTIRASVCGSEGLLEARRAQELAEARKEA